MNKFDAKKMVVVDMGAGSYTRTNVGHELFNLKPNPVDGKFYGYCPAEGYLTIGNFGAGNDDSYIDDVLVVYTTKKENSTDRKIIAFCPQARVYRKNQSGKEKGRFMPGDEKPVDYSIESEHLINLENSSPIFTIELRKYSRWMFRKLRFYGETYRDLAQEIIAYIEGMLNNDDDLSDYQKQVQDANPVTKKEQQNSADRQVETTSGPSGESVKKNPSLAKSVIVESGYKCIIDQNHETFQTKKGERYMEGHHLIPCTPRNARNFEEKDGKNIDCIENIVSICPTCHRAIHFGCNSTKEALVKTLYARQKNKLEEVGLRITEAELLALYIAQ